MAPLRTSLDEAVRRLGRGRAPRRGRRLLATTPLTVALAINRALHDVLARHPEALVFGEDVARKGGVYGVTRGLQARPGRARVFDTLLDEQAILGLALGRRACRDCCRFPRSSTWPTCTTPPTRSAARAPPCSSSPTGQYRNPMVVRIAGYGYQKGFGGHFHNDNSVAALRDIPGIVIASPARPDDAAAMLRACVAAATRRGAVCVFLEPIALYHTRDLHDDGDGGWLARYPDAGEPPRRSGGPERYGDGTRPDDRHVRQRRADEPAGARAARAQRHRHAASWTCGGWRRCRSTTSCARPPPPAGCWSSTRPGAPAGCRRGRPRRAGRRRLHRRRSQRVASQDSFIPLGDAALQVLLAEETIEAAAIKLVRAGES